MSNKKAGKTGKKDLLDEGKRSMKEFDLAWDEFFRDKPKPKSDEEDLRQQQEFCEWYNNVRKQSDTGKTPVEMGDRILNFGRDDGELHVPPTRHCPECGGFGLEVGKDVNAYDCQICGSQWRRLKPINDGTGKMINMPAKLKKMLEQAGARE